MAYCGHKKEDIEDTSMDRHWKQARPEKPWNPWGQLPAPQRGGGSEEDEALQSDQVSYNYAFQFKHCLLPTFEKYPNKPLALHICNNILTIIN